MTAIGLWCIILSAATMASIIGAAIGTLIMSTKWYRKYVTKISLKYTEELLENHTTFGGEMTSEEFDKKFKPEPTDE